MNNTTGSNSIRIATFERLILLVRKELRLLDNSALWNASRDAKEIIPLFIVDEEFYSYAPAKQQVMMESLREMQSSLRAIGGDLCIRYGNAETIIGNMLAEMNAAGVYTSCSYEPVARNRAHRLRSLVEQQGKCWREFQDSLLFAPGEITTTSGTPYTVFTAFKNSALSRLQDIYPTLPAPKRVKTPICQQEDAVEIRGITGIRGGEKIALRQLQSFIKKKAFDYKDSRDTLVLNGTSRLSHHFNSGALSVRTVLHTMLSIHKKAGREHNAGIQAYLNELLWREFYYHVLWNFPHVVERSFKPSFDRLAWGEHAELFELWCAGRTGYPVVDAAMRQLNTEYWMHNRARMIVASFLTKDLHINWKKGEQYFLSKLVDGDLALNNGGWQWSAGTGTDAQPWFRIFNPVLQGKKFDPKGAYVRAYVPELAHVSEQFIHEPWKMPRAVQERSGCIIGKDYPFPVVAHDEERKKTIEMFKSVNC